MIVFFVLRFTTALEVDSGRADLIGLKTITKVSRKHNLQHYTLSP